MPEYVTLSWNVAGIVALAFAVAAVAARSVALAGSGWTRWSRSARRVVVVRELSGAGEERQRRALPLIGYAFAAGGVPAGAVDVGAGGGVPAAALASTFVTSAAGVVTFTILSTRHHGPVAPDWPTGIALGIGGLAGAYTGARSGRACHFALAGPGGGSPARILLARAGLWETASECGNRGRDAARRGMMGWGQGGRR
jgi:hypothetical protein